MSERVQIKKYILPCVIKAGEPTANRRVYSEEVLKRAVEDLKEPVRKGHVVLFKSTALSSRPSLTEAVGIVREIEVGLTLQVEPVRDFQLLFKGLNAMVEEGVDRVHNVPVGHGSTTRNPRDGYEYVNDDYKIDYFTFLVGKELEG